MDDKSLRKALKIFSFQKPKGIAATTHEQAEEFKKIWQEGRAALEYQTDRPTNDLEKAPR